MAFVWFGDSIAAGKKAKPATWFLDSVGVPAVNRAEAGTGFSQAREAVQDFAFVAADVAVIHTGINNLAAGADGIEVGQGIADVVASVPSSVTACVLPILPYRNISASGEAERLAANAWLAANVPAFYPEAEEPLTDPEDGVALLPECLADGIHLTALAQRRLALAVLLEYRPADYAPADWQFGTFPWRDWSGSAETLGARWEVWPKLLPAGYADGYCGALAIVDALPDLFTIRASFRVEVARPNAFCSIVTRATPRRWLQYGWNIASGPVFRALEWNAGGPSTFHNEADLELARLASDITDGHQSIELSVTHHAAGVDFYGGSAVIGQQRQMAEVGRSQPPAIPANGLGFWFSSAELVDFDVTTPDLVGRP